MRTAQQMFDVATAHLLGQARKSQKTKFRQDGTVSQMCAYRGRGGLKCAVGVFIPDEDYRPRMEMSLECLVLSRFDDLREKEWYRELGAHFELMKELQHIHDMTDPESWEAGLRALAKSRRLRFNTKAGDKT